MTQNGPDPEAVVRDLAQQGVRAVRLLYSDLLKRTLTRYAFVASRPTNRDSVCSSGRTVTTVWRSLRNTRDVSLVRAMTNVLPPETRQVISPPLDVDVWTRLPLQPVIVRLAPRKRAA